jgi:hypothetical protein
MYGARLSKRTTEEGLRRRIKMPVPREKLQITDLKCAEVKRAIRTAVTSIKGVTKAHFQTRKKQQLH